MTLIRYRTVDVDSFKVFYRRGGVRRCAETIAVAWVP